MRRRTFEEMITYFNQTVSEMDIDRKHKMTLLGIVTALLQKHDEDVAQIVRCKDCKYSDTFPEDADNDMPLKCLGIRYGGVYPNWFCEHAERREEWSN